jgi:hypothetical protein
LLHREATIRNGPARHGPSAARNCHGLFLAYAVDALILINTKGVSGTGKSTLGAAIAKNLSMPFIDGDGLHPKANIDKMASGQPLTDKDREPWLEIIRTKAEHMSVEQHVDPSFHHSSWCCGSLFSTEEKLSKYTSRAYNGPKYARALATSRSGYATYIFRIYQRGEGCIDGQDVEKTGTFHEGKYA